MLGIWTASLLLLGTVKGATYCFEEIEACVTDNYPWTCPLLIPFTQTPWSPKQINTRLLLYTPQNPNSYQEINARNISTISSSNFRTNRKTRLIIHGWFEKGDDFWLTEMCKRMLQVEDVNCICVDWQGGSKTTYSQAVTNAQVVGAAVAYFINILLKNVSYPLSNVHIISHSLGVHAAGEAGKRRPGISRITALDPAGPCFEGAPPEVRLDPTDANCVDVIHTNGGPLIPALRFGMSQLVGHLDFYPNGGEEMPGCKKDLWTVVLNIVEILKEPVELLMCDHHRSYWFYLESILNKDGFLGYPSSSYASFKESDGFPCPSGDCPRMGHYAECNGGGADSSQRLYLNTGAAENYARYRYKTSVTVTGDNSFTGYINVVLYGTQGNTRQHQIVKGTIEPGRTYTAFIDVEVDVGSLIQVKFLWHKDDNIFTILQPKSKMGGQTADVQYGKDGTTSRFCGSGTEEEDILQTMNAC